jgi:hypothetical protein
MVRRIILSLTMLALLALASTLSFATAEHTYGKNEYEIIRDGLAPNKQWSLAAHGEGEDAESNFHIWLMAEPAHRKLSPLDDIGSDNNLDTAPEAYYAFWAPDSRHVAVSFRSDRHISELILYAIESGRTKLVAGPSLLRELMGRDLGENDALRQSYAEFEWRGADRFVLKEHRTLATKDKGLLGKLGAFGRLVEKQNDGQLIVQFSAEADCQLAPDHRYRVVALRRGKFAD